MKTDQDVQSVLSRIDGKGYKAYKDIEGRFGFKRFELIIDHVQGDPFAAPSRLRVVVPQNVAGFPKDFYSNRSREIACRDYLVRRFYKAAKKIAKGNRGSGKSGTISITPPAQEILERTAVLIDSEHVEARFTMGLPAFGRRIAGEQARVMIFKELTRIVETSLLYDRLDSDELTEHINTSEDADYIRNNLNAANCVAFIADKAVLPRQSGINPEPLAGENVVPFKSPEPFRIEFDTPNHGTISGMGIPKGVTLIVGGGYHGKSTVLNAIEKGVYNHIPGDGREFVVSNRDTVKIRSEDGRRIEKTCISPFITNLPQGRDTRAFSTDDASGSTSQAANIMEMLEIGAKTLLIDEDTSATNFMIRDQRMQELVSKQDEPITPFIDKIQQLYRKVGVSTVLVLGGSGDYFEVADHVMCMHNYLPENVTQEAHQIAEQYASHRKQEGGAKFGEIVDRIPRANSLDPSKGKRAVKIKERGVKEISFGVHTIDLSASQLVDRAQTRAIGDALNIAKKRMRNKATLKEIVDEIQNDIIQNGLESIYRQPSGGYAAFRKYELAAAVNRLRSLVVDQKR